MKIEQLKKNGNAIMPLTHGDAVFCNDGFNVSRHLDMLNDAVKPNGYVVNPVEIDYGSSPYWINATPRVFVRQSNQFSTIPIELKNGETIEFDCYADGRISALAKLSSAEESSSMSAQRLLVGTSPNNTPEVKKYTYTADADDAGTSKRE